MADTRASDYIARWGTMRNARSTWEQHWREIAALVLPRQDDFFETTKPQGEKRTAKLFDSRAPRALVKFAAVMDMMLTPRQSIWHRLKLKGQTGQTGGEGSRWLDEVNQLIYDYRYSPRANYASQQHENYMALGAFGTACMFIDTGKDYPLAYRGCHLADVYFDINASGQIDTVYRRLMLSARQAVQMFGDDDLPDRIRRNAGNVGTQDEMSEFLHCVHPNSDKVNGRQDRQGQAWASAYVSTGDNEVIRRGGYRTFPYAISRYTVAPREVYGRSPAMDVLPDIKMLNEAKKAGVRQWHQMLDPPIMLSDDVTIPRMNMRAGAMNPGMLDDQGRPRAVPWNSGARLDVDAEIRAELYAGIDDGMLVSVLQMVVEKNNMTAYEIAVRVKEQGWMLSPTAGRQQSECLGPTLEREFDLLADANLLPPAPPEIMEMGGEYEIEYQSPLSIAAKSEAAAGVLRYLSAVGEVAQSKPAILDNVNEDEMSAILAEANLVPNKGLNSPEQRDAIRQQRAQAEQAQEMVAAAKPVAGAVKDLSQAAAMAA